MRLRRSSLDWVIQVSDKSKHEELARVERLNQELGASLKRCRKMLHDYEVRLTANFNEPIARADEQESGKA